jgi:hypothetical protein
MLRTTRVCLVVAATAAATLVALVQPVVAAGFGPRFGLTIDPDQVHAGMQFHVGNLTPHLAFVPGFEVGVGDEIIGVAGNMDFLYYFGRGPARWRPYLGGGPGIFFWDADGYDSNTEVGVNFVGGMRTPTRSGAFFGEMRLGLIDSPDIKFTVGWMFR